MKKDIHPKYDIAEVECSCGEKFVTRSTMPKIHIEICSKCHPFFTGTQKLVDTAGRVDKFKERMKRAEEHREKVKSQKSQPKADGPRAQKVKSKKEPKPAKKVVEDKK